MEDEMSEQPRHLHEDNTVSGLADEAGVASSAEGTESGPASADDEHAEGGEEEDSHPEPSSEDCGQVPSSSPSPKPFDIFEFVRDIKCPPRQKEAITHFDEAAAANPHQILRSIFTFLASRTWRQGGGGEEGGDGGPSEADKVLVLNMGHELLFAYFDDQVDPPGETEQQLALDALKMVYRESSGASMAYRRELNNVVSLIWKLSDEIDIDGSDRQVDNFVQLLRYCLNPATHTAAETERERYELAELGFTLFSRIMHELLLPYLLAHEEGEEDDGPAHFVEQNLFSRLSTTLTDPNAPLSLRVAAAMVITNAFNSELPSCIPGFTSLSSLVPNIVQTIPELYAVGNFEKLEELLRSFDNLSLPFLLNHMPLYAQTLMCLATTPVVPGRLRSVALQPLITLSGFVCFLLHTDKKYANVLSTEANFRRFLVRHLMHMFLLAEPRKEELEESNKQHSDGDIFCEGKATMGDVEAEDHEDSPVAVASWALSALISSFGHIMMVPICLSYIGQYLMCQHEWQYPHAALRALAALMKAYGRVAPPARLDPLVYIVLHYYQHPNISLRIAAAICLGRMAKHVPGFAHKFSGLIFPVFNDRLKDSSVSVLITTCRAMTYFSLSKPENGKLAKDEDEDEDEEDQDQDEEDVDAEEEEQEAEEERMAGKSLPDGEIALPSTSAVATTAEDAWSDRLVQGLSSLVKDGNPKVKEHAVTALFNITQLSSSILKKHLPQLVELCLDMLSRKLPAKYRETPNLRTIGRVLRCTMQIGVVGGKKNFQVDALKFINALANPSDTVERLMQGAPSYVASALGRIGLCMQLDFAPYLSMFFNVMERSITAECGDALLMTEDRPVDMDGWDIAESVDDFGGVQKVYVYKREIRDKRIAINSLCSVMNMFADSAEGAQHFCPYITRTHCLLLRMLRLVDNNFEVMGGKELSFCKFIPVLIKIYNQAKAANQEEKETAKSDPEAALSRPSAQVTQSSTDRQQDVEKKEEKGKEKDLEKEEEESFKENAEPQRGDVYGGNKTSDLINLVEPLWQELGNAYERAQEPKKSIGLLGLWDSMLSAANAECLSSTEVHTTSEHLLGVLYDCEHYMAFGEQLGGEASFEDGATYLASSLIPSILEGLLQHHPRAFDSAYLLQHVIPSVVHGLEATAFEPIQLGCLLVLDSVLDYMIRPAEYVDAIYPSFFNFISNTDAAIAQAACYGLGICANLTTPESHKTASDAICQHFPALAQATLKWLSRAQAAREQADSPQIPEQWACDNMLSAQAKIFRRHFYNMPNLTGSIDAWLQCLPLRVDTMEMAEVMTILCEFINSENASVRMFIASRRSIVAQALKAQLAEFSSRGEHVEKVYPLLPLIKQLETLDGESTQTTASGEGEENTSSRP